jgi:transposase
VDADATTVARAGAATSREVGVDPSEIAVFVGVDVGKEHHVAVALDRSGEVLLEQVLAQDESRLRDLLESLIARGPVLLVVDQPASIGALVVAVARDVGVQVGYLPGLAMRRIADLHPGEAKTDSRDAHVIAQAARTLPHALRSLRADDEQIAELAMLAGFDDDLHVSIVSATNRLRGLLTQIHPALERVVGPELDHAGTLELLMTYPSPEQLRSAGTDAITQAIATRSPRIAARLAAAVEDALDRQSVVVTGTAAAAEVVPRLAAQLLLLRDQRRQIEAQVERLVEAHPLSPVLTSMPGVGVRTATRILTEVVGKDFPTAGHLAAYAGLAPVTRRSGSSIRGEHAPRGGNRRLKRSLFLSAFAALSDPTSRTYYDRKRTEHKTHNQAVLALARRRCDVLFAMLRDGTHYEPDHAKAA